MRKPWRMISAVLGALGLALGGIAVLGISSAAEGPPFSRAAKPLGGCETNLQVYEEAVRSLALSKEMEDSAQLEALEENRDDAFLAYCDCLIAESAGRFDDRTRVVPVAEVSRPSSTPPAKVTPPGGGGSPRPTPIIPPKGTPSGPSPKLTPPPPTRTTPNLTPNPKGTPPIAGTPRLTPILPSKPTPGTTKPAGR
jgi:hypothetical protein